MKRRLIALVTVLVLLSACGNSATPAPPSGSGAVWDSAVWDSANWN